MSYFDNAPGQELAQTNRAALNPATPDDMAATMFGGIPTAIAGGVERAIFKTQGLAEDAGIPVARAIDKQFGTDTETWLAKESAATQKRVRELQPDPYVTGAVGRGLGGLAEVLPLFAVGNALGGPAGGAALAGTVEGYAGVKEGLADGLDPLTAFKKGAIEGAATAAGGFLPMSIAGAPLWKTFAFGSGVNLGFGVANRGLTSSVLEQAGYHDQAEQYKMLDKASVAADVILGLAFAGLGHVMHPKEPGAAPREAPKAPRPEDMPAPSTVDAAQVVTSEIHRRDVAGIPADTDTANIINSKIADETMALLAGTPRRADPVNPEAVHTIDDPNSSPKQIQTALSELQAEQEAVNKTLADIAVDDAAARVDHEGIIPPPEPTGASPIEFGEAARKRFLREIKRHGGIDIAEASDIVGERGFRAVAGAAGIFRRPVANASGTGRSLGHSMDRHVEWMVDHGYMTEAEVANDPAGGVDRARELVAQALGKEPVLTFAEQQQITALQAEHEAAGFTDQDHAAARFDSLPPPERLEYDRWLAYADELQGIHNEIDAIRSLGPEAISGENGTPGPGRTEARAGGDRGGESLQEITRAGERSDQQSSDQVNEPQKDTYSGDLFGNALPDRTGTDQRAGGDRRSEPVSPVRPADEISPGIFAASTAFVETATVRVGSSTVKTAADAAHVFSYLRKSPQEQVAILTVDANGKALALVRHSLGRRAEAMFEMSTAVGSALRDPRTAQVWIAHNHPSGNDRFSLADTELHKGVTKAFATTPVDYRGFFAIAKDRYAFIDPHDTISQEAIPPARRTESISLQDRVYRQSGRLAEPITGPNGAIDAAEKIAKGGTGLLLLDTQHAPVAWLPLTMEQMTRARTLDHVQRHIWTGLESSNASNAIVIVNGGFDSTHALGTIYAMQSLLQKKAGVRMLDAINFTGGTATKLTAVQKAMEKEGGAKEGEPLLTTYTNADALQREADVAAAANLDEKALAVQKAKAIADAQRDTFALTGSDRLADTAGQDSLFEPAQVYPGTIDEPMGRDAALAGADARVADADANADKAIATAVQCGQVEGSA